MMCRYSISILLALLCLHFGMCTKSGLKIYLTEESVDSLLKTVWSTNYYMGDATIRKGIKMHDQNGQYRLGIFGPCNWNVTNIEIHGVEKPFSSVKFEHGGVRVKVSKLAFEVTATWGLYINTNRLGDSLPSVMRWDGHREGEFRMHICLNGDVNFGFERHKGISGIKLSHCRTPTICGAEATITGGYAYPTFLQKAINYLFTNVMKKAFSSWVCPQMRLGMKKVEPHFKESDLTPGYMIHTVIKQIKIGSEFAQSDMLGEVRIDGLDYLNDSNPMEAPNVPMHPLNITQKIQLMATSYPISTMIFSAIRKGLYNKLVIPTQLPANQAVYFATNCKDACIGTWIPKLSKEYPLSFVNATVGPTNDLRVYIRKTHILLEGNYSANFSVNGTTLFGLLFPIIITFVPHHIQDTVIIKGTLTDIHTGTAALSTRVPMHVINKYDIPQNVMNTLRDVIVKVHVTNQVKEISTKEFDLTPFLARMQPTECGRRIGITNMALHLEEGYIAVLADITIGLDPC